VFGLLWAGLVALSLTQQAWLRHAAWVATRIVSAQVFKHPTYLAGMLVMVLLALLLIKLPITAAGDPSEPAPPTAMM